ncbi:MAG: PD40 domain-containing protein [Deltaproteobacteria bacterium]|nr:PD40 domain-containing protein [Deltaproteobacteria bacterium]
MRAWMIGLLIAPTTACDAGPSRSGEPTGTTSAAVASAPRAAGGPLRLIDVHRLAGGADRFFVSPRWSPDGDRLLLSGWRGVGLWTVDPGTGEVHEVDTTCQGPAFWAPDGSGVAFRADDASGAWQLRSLAAGPGRLAGRPEFVPSTVPAGDVPADAELLFDGRGRRVAYEEYRGRLEAWESGDRRVLASEGAAGPRASADGARVAWWTGPLLDPTLHVAGLDGHECFAGPGAHPAWLADGERLVYAVPQAGPGPDDAPRVAASELRLLDLRDGSSTALTATPDAAEMQPAIAPDGRRLAFADWATGEILLGRLVDVPGGAP